MVKFADSIEITSTFNSYFQYQDTTFILFTQLYNFYIASHLLISNCEILTKTKFNGLIKTVELPFLRIFSIVFPRKAPFIGLKRLIVR